MSDETGKASASTFEAKRQSIFDSLETICAEGKNALDILRRFSEVVLAELADLIAFDLVEDDGSITRAVTRLKDPEKQRLAEAARRDVPISITSAYGYPRVIKTGKSQFMPGVPDRVAHLIMPGDPATKTNSGITVRSYLCVPLIACNRTLGAMTLARLDQTSPFVSEDLLFMEQVAQKLADCFDRRLTRDRSAA